MKTTKQDTQEACSDQCHMISFCHHLSPVIQQGTDSTGENDDIDDDLDSPITTKQPSLLDMIASPR